MDFDRAWNDAYADASVAAEMGNHDGEWRQSEALSRFLQRIAPGGEWIQAVATFRGLAHDAEMDRRRPKAYFIQPPFD
jgi:hypothetical protein